MVAPFIRPLQVEGGTFYTFSSSAEDLGLTFNNSGLKFRFSKYALLKLPNIAVPVYQDNKIQFGAIDGHLIAGLNADNNVNLAESFQNYALNLESLLVSQTSYDRYKKLNVAERVFWKWLKELGAIRYKQANSLESALDTTTDPRFLEEAEILTGTTRYNKVVQYIGSIDVVNNVQNNVNAYTEVYIHVPTSDGSTPIVLFKTVDDVNYTPGMTIINQPPDPLDTEIINGRHYNDTHPAGLSINAIYDQDVVGSPTSYFYNSGTSAYDISGNWYDPLAGPNAYFTDASFVDVTNDLLQKTYGLVTVTYVRSRLDGVCLDFDPTSYTQIANSHISTIDEYNSTVTAQPFEFNVVLVYYDVYDPNNVTDTATNLYGVLFLENVEQISTEEGIPSFKKFRPNPITKLNGNSYGFKINLKFDTSVDNVGTEQAINDYSSFSMELFVDTMNILQDASRVLTDQIAEIEALKSRILELEDLVLNLETYAEINLRLSTIEESLLTSQSLFNNSTTIMDLIQKNRDEITNLIDGRTSIDVTYNIDVIKNGSGITIDRSSVNNVRIINNVQGANFGTSYQGDLSTSSIIKLQEFSNYFRHYNGGSSYTSTTDIYLKIDDTDVKWKKGQTFRLVFEDIFDIGSHSIILVTDAPNVMGAGIYGIIIGVISGAQFDSAGDRPIFDITCVDANSMTFVIDQIR